MYSSGPNFSCAVAAEVLKVKVKVKVLSLYMSHCVGVTNMKMKGGVIVLAGVAGLLGVDGAITPTTDHNMNGDVYLLAPTPGQSSPANWSTRYPLSLSSFLLLFSS
jgi:hypothetical protein